MPYHFNTIYRENPLIQTSLCTRELNKSTCVYIPISKRLSASDKHSWISAESLIWKMCLMLDWFLIDIGTCLFVFLKQCSGFDPNVGSFSCCVLLHFSFPGSRHSEDASVGLEHLPPEVTDSCHDIYLEEQQIASLATPLPVKNRCNPPSCIYLWQDRWLHAYALATTNTIGNTIGNSNT